MKGGVIVIRGACQQFKFKTPYTLDQLKTVRITFWQCDNNGTKDKVISNIADINYGANLYERMATKFIYNNIIFIIIFTYIRHIIIISCDVDIL